MRRETAYKLAGRHHTRHGVTGVSGDLDKVREIRLYHLPADQLPRACECLARVRLLQAQPGERPLCLQVRYSILDHSLEAIENFLTEAGFHLDHSLYAKFVRSLVYYCEDVQRHNLHQPERLIKQSNEVYMKVYDQHLHGDHDDTPPDLREFR